jgi:hypothetical protein
MIHQLLIHRDKTHIILIEFGESGLPMVVEDQDGFDHVVGDVSPESGFTMLSSGDGG